MMKSNFWSVKGYLKTISACIKKNFVKILLNVLKNIVFGEINTLMRIQYLKPNVFFYNIVLRFSMAQTRRFAPDKPLFREIICYFKNWMWKKIPPEELFFSVMFPIGDLANHSDQ